MQLSLYPNQTLRASFLNPQPQHCLGNCAEQLTKWYTVKLDRDLWQCGQNYQADREGRHTGQKKAGSSGLCHECLKQVQRPPPFCFSLAHRHDGISVREGDYRTNKNMENRGGKSAREMGPYLRSKLKSSTKMISWMRLGGVRFRTLQGSREEKDSLCELPK